MTATMLSRLAAAIPGSLLAAAGIAAAVCSLYPDPRPLNRVFAGLFAGIAAWLVLILGCIIAATATRAWCLVLLGGGAAMALLGLAHAGLAGAQ